MTAKATCATACAKGEKEGSRPLNLEFIPPAQLLRSKPATSPRRAATASETRLPMELPTRTGASMALASRKASTWSAQRSMEYGPAAFSESPRPRRSRRQHSKPASAKAGAFDLQVSRELPKPCSITTGLPEPSLQ